MVSAGLVQSVLRILGLDLKPGVILVFQRDILERFDVTGFFPYIACLDERLDRLD